MLVGGVSGRSASHISCLLMFIVRLGMLLMLVDVHVHVETSFFVRDGGELGKSAFITYSVVMLAAVKGEGLSEV